ncbi:hypothetical protein FQA39_LY02428 [Lamprigera yunnana]|nr:hypothetical protein FQA39_LY02428 [Lamprigera yunnana]
MEDFDSESESTESNLDDSDFVQLSSKVQENAILSEEDISEPEETEEANTPRKVNSSRKSTNATGLELIFTMDLVPSRISLIPFCLRIIVIDNYYDFFEKATLSFGPNNIMWCHRSDNANIEIFCLKMICYPLV